MKFAYADPPYLGCGRLYAKHHPDALVWDDPATHHRLIERLCDEFPDGWAMSCHTPSLRTLLPMCPDDVRVASWCKSFGVFKPNVNPAYVWEPVLYRGGRKYTRQDNTVRDFMVCPITLMKGLPGAKPEEFCRWVIMLLNAQEGDELHDLFPGTGVMGRVFDEWCSALPFRSAAGEEGK